MILRKFSRLNGSAAESVDLKLPFVVPLTAGTATITAEDLDGEYRVVLERKVDPDALALRLNTGRRHVGSEIEIPMVEVLSTAIEESETAVDVAAALSFVTDEPFTASISLDEHDELVPETPEDEALLESFRTREVWRHFTGGLSMRTFAEPITPELVSALLPKRVGLHLYADALRHGTASARFRDYWRVLESAFALKDGDLIAALAQYEPAIQVGFTRDELEDLRTFRGRASHAESSKGIAEYWNVRSEAAERVARLKTLVERVLITKKHWGSRSPAVVELAQLKGFVGPGVVSRKELRDLPDEDLLKLIIERTRLDENAAREMLDVTRGRPAIRP